MADAAGPAPGQLSQAPDQAALMPTDATGRLKPRAGERQARPSDIVVRSEAASPPRMAPGLAGASSPQRSSSPFHGSAASPSHLLRSASPRHLSPATSQIFERDVQEAVVAPELSPGIPSHIQTEDHIPPVLEASSLALTDRHLDPDEVEIVTHSAHQPAGLNVAGGAPPALSDSFASASGMSSLNELAAAAAAPGALDHADEAASPAYGTVDLNDNRRLSFISFADVVHAEHAESMRDGMHPLSASSASLPGARSPSPIRSPLSSGGGGSPPASGAASFRGVEVSPVRGTGASIASSHGPGHGHGSGHGELTIETMRQALQKPNSNELPGGGGTASAPISPVGADMPGRFPQ